CSADVRAPSRPLSGDPAFVEIEAGRSAAGVPDLDVHVFLVAVVVVAKPRALDLRDLDGPGSGTVRTGCGWWNRTREVAEYSAPRRGVPLGTVRGSCRDPGDAADFRAVDSGHDDPRVESYCVTRPFAATEKAKPGSSP